MMGTYIAAPRRREHPVSLIPFATGDKVIECTVVDGERRRQLVSIADHGDDWCQTDTGHLYSRIGTRIPPDDPYRSITTPGYEGAKP